MAFNSKDSLSPNKVLQGSEPLSKQSSHARRNNWTNESAPIFTVLKTTHSLGLRLCSINNTKHFIGSAIYVRIGRHFVKIISHNTARLR